MVNKKIKAIAKIERDAQNYFFVKMLYGYSDSQNELQTAYEIEDEGLKDNLVALSYTALNAFEYGKTIDGDKTIVICDSKTKYPYHGYGTDYTAPDRIITGNIPLSQFKEINFLIRMISYIMKKEKLGEFWVQYEDKTMTSKEFMEFQKEISI